MTREAYFSPPDPIFPTMTLPEAELAWMDDTQKYTTVMEHLQQAGLYNRDSIYCGIDAEELKRTASFGDRRVTWAVTEAEFKTAISDAEKYGESNLNPLSYAFTAGLQPALAVYDKTAFDNLEADGAHTENEWQLRAGRTMDEATRAVIFFA